MTTICKSANSLYHGIYTLPDTALILGLSLNKLRRWVSGVQDVASQQNRYGLGDEGIVGNGYERHLDFLTLVEIFTIYQLRDRGISFPKIKAIREELINREHTSNPFALEGLLVEENNRIYKEIDGETSLELGTGGQVSMQKVIESFVERLDFEGATKLARRFYPHGKTSSVVVDPKISFGRPTIIGTSITTESLGLLRKGNEKIEDIASQFDLSEQEVRDAIAFEFDVAA